MIIATATTVITINVSRCSTSSSHNEQAAAATSACKMQAATAASRELERAETTEEALTSLAKAARALSCMCFPFPRSSQVFRWLACLEPPKVVKNHSVYEVFHKVHLKSHFLTCNFLMCLLHFWLVRSDFLMGSLHFHLLFFLRCQSAF